MNSSSEQFSVTPRWFGCPQSNFHRNRAGLRPEAIVIHIMDGNFAAGESVFADPTTHKSAHYGISQSGIVHQYVEETDTAFHAGIVVRPTWKLLKPRVNPNFYTIGIEHEGTADDVWPSAQLTASSTMIAQIAARWAIPLDENHVILHHQIRASKTCPGNWLRDVSMLLNLVPKIDQHAATINPSATNIAKPEAALSS
jgi:N-acetylmuramoyl-L-alanine amidase